jgi:hypothetical protein
MKNEWSQSVLYLIELMNIYPSSANFCVGNLSFYLKWSKLGSNAFLDFFFSLVGLAFFTLTAE